MIYQFLLHLLTSSNTPFLHLVMDFSSTGKNSGSYVLFHLLFPSRLSMVSKMKGLMTLWNDTLIGWAKQVSKFKRFHLRRLKKLFYTEKNHVRGVPQSGTDVSSELKGSHSFCFHSSIGVSMEVLLRTGHMWQKGKHVKIWVPFPGRFRSERREKKKQR
jgi:hypothetical protein